MNVYVLKKNINEFSVIANTKFDEWKKNSKENRRKLFLPPKFPPPLSYLQMADQSNRLVKLATWECFNFNLYFYTIKGKNEKEERK